MFGDRLKLARKKAGLSLQALAGQVSPPITAQAISKYEAGRMMPSSAVLAGLGKALGVSLDFLMSGHVAALSGVEFRKHSATSSKDRAHAEAIVIEKLEDYLAIEDILELNPPADPFGALRADGVSSWQEIEDKARELRDEWALGTDPVPSMTDLLEQKGIKVIEADLPERFDGLACDVQRTGGRPDTEVVVISSHTNIERKRFNLAHELAHRLIKGVTGSDIKLEKAMNRFAGAFLAPREHLEAEVGRGRSAISYPELRRLKHFYGMSAAAMLIRVRDLGLVPEASVEYAFRTYAQAWRTKEPDPIKAHEGLGAFERPIRFEQLVYRALSEELIAPARAALLLKRPLSAIERDMRGPKAS